MISKLSRLISRSRSRAAQRGQTATEYMLVISVLVIGVTYVTYRMFDSDGGPFAQALKDLLGTTSGTYDEDRGHNIPAEVSRGYVSSNPSP